MLVSPGCRKLLYVVAGSPSTISVFGIATNGGLVTAPASFKRARQKCKHHQHCRGSQKVNSCTRRNLGKWQRDQPVHRLGPTSALAASRLALPFAAGNRAEWRSRGWHWILLFYVSNKGSNDVFSVLSRLAGVLGPGRRIALHNVRLGSPLAADGTRVSSQSDSAKPPSYM